MQQSYVTQTAYSVGNAAAAGEREKDQHHEAKVTSTGSIFHPLVCESLGLWSQHSLEVLKTIARRLSFKRNLTVSQAVGNIHEQLSVKLWLHNAKMILHRLALDCTDMFFWIMCVRYPRRWVYIKYIFQYIYIYIYIYISYYISMTLQVLVDSVHAVQRLLLFCT